MVRHHGNGTVCSDAEAPPSTAHGLPALMSHEETKSLSALPCIAFLEPTDRVRSHSNERTGQPQEQSDGLVLATRHLSPPHQFPQGLMSASAGHCPGPRF